MKSCRRLFADQEGPLGVFRDWLFFNSLADNQVPEKRGMINKYFLICFLIELVLRRCVGAFLMELITLKSFVFGTRGDNFPHAPHAGLVQVLRRVW